jgi:beta-glucosidase
MKRLVLLVLTLSACDVVPSFSEAMVNAAHLGAALPHGFLLGTATSSHQIEGSQQNDWADWEQGSYPDGQPHIRNRDTSQVADGSWTRWPQDVDALQALGANAYRFSVEWSRLEPEDGVWNEEAAANYRAQLVALRARGITPLLTIHHYTFPRWVAAKGGWEWNDADRNVTDALAAFAGRLGDHFGDLVDFWCTINEPNVAVFDAYLFGDYPPGVQDLTRMSNAYLQTMRAHAKMAAALRASDLVDADGDGFATRIGVAHHVAIWEPTTTDTLDTTVTGLTDDFFNEMVPRAAKTGHVKLYVPGSVDLDEVVPGLEGSFDYLGINYYSRYDVRFDLSDPSLSKQYFPPGRAKSDLGYEIYPEGLYRALMRMRRWGWPMYILESGVADAAGTQMPQYLRAHLYAMEQAMAHGADVRGYFHWSLVDNFEWADGYFGKMGLFRVDQSDPGLTRQPTEAARTFEGIVLERR